MTGDYITGFLYEAIKVAILLSAPMLLAWLAVGLVAFVYSLNWKPNQSILMYFAMVNNVWLGPAGAVMLGGLYLIYNTF